MWVPPLIFPGVKIISVEPISPPSSFPSHRSRMISNPDRCWGLGYEVKNTCKLTAYSHYMKRSTKHQLTNTTVANFRSNMDQKFSLTPTVCLNFWVHRSIKATLEAAGFWCVFHQNGLRWDAGAVTHTNVTNAWTKNAVAILNWSQVSNWLPEPQKSSSHAEYLSCCSFCHLSNLGHKLTILSTICSMRHILLRHYMASISLFHMVQSA